ncbi:MAG: hypothetical protein LBQ59_03700 [Candidatus Peribacteria bacterium]|nr:hypothetical protein [Candidatus Peribacteria bacterium]
MNSVAKAAHLTHKLGKNQYQNINIGSIIKFIITQISIIIIGNLTSQIHLIIA